jgi:hypothetical protein
MWRWYASTGDDRWHSVLMCFINARWMDTKDKGLCCDVIDAVRCEIHCELSVHFFENCTDNSPPREQVTTTKSNHSSRVIVQSVLEQNLEQNCARTKKGDCALC